MHSDQKQEVRVHIRWMIRRDMPEVLDIEKECFEFPWLEEDFVNCLRQRNCIGMVAEHDDRVVGFMIYELHKTRIHVLNFVVAKDYQRQRRGQSDDRQTDRQTLARSAAAALCWKCAKPIFPRNYFSAKTASAQYRCCAVTTPTRPKTPTSCSIATGRKKFPHYPPTALRDWPVSTNPSKIHCHSKHIEVS